MKRWSKKSRPSEPRQSDAQPFHREGRPRAIALGRPSCQTLGVKGSDMNWLEPWHSAEELDERLAQGLLRQLQVEVPPEHALYGVPVKLLARGSGDVFSSNYWMAADAWQMFISLGRRAKSVCLGPEPTSMRLCQTGRTTPWRRSIRTGRVEVLYVLPPNPSFQRTASSGR
jgi:hypothetical protein